MARGSKWRVSVALVSVRSLMSVINDMSEKEVLSALTLESESRRRQSILRRLFGRAARLNEQQYVNQLRRKFHHGSKR